MTAPTIGDAGRMTGQGARSAGISYQELLDTDTHPVPESLRLQSPILAPPTKVPREWYFAKEIHELEVEKLWKRVWQMACREEDIPGVGDYLVYDIAHLSFLVVRSGPHEFKAFPNACLHRGRQLREWGGRGATEFRCPFHGWAWEINGALKEVVCPWDFPEVTPANSSLPEAKVGTWGGFVFINPDPEAGPLEAFLGDLPQHFERWDLEHRFKQAHVAKILRCNWKAAQEAFMEAYHVVVTHPQILESIGDSNSQYDVFGNFSRAISAGATPSPHLKAWPSEQEKLNSMLDVQYGAEPQLKVGENESARTLVAASTREGLRHVVGDGVDGFSDAEFTDSFYYTQFPNFHPWGGFNRITYRFRPNGDDPDTCIMETMFLAPCPKDGPRPAAAQIHWLGVDDDYTQAPELGMLARVFQQDTFNLPKVQIGLKAARQPYVQFANYNETKPRHFYHLYEQWLDLG